MLITSIVKLVNQKSAGETEYSYEELYPFLQGAIDSLNSDLKNAARAIDDFPYPDDPNNINVVLHYDGLPDKHIRTYVVTYTVVAMDQAELSATSRTQYYATELRKYTEDLKSDLYKLMPVTHTASYNSSFDMTGSRQEYITTSIPTLGKIFYDNSYGKIANGKAITELLNTDKSFTGVRCDNIYGKFYYDYNIIKRSVGKDKVVPTTFSTSIKSYPFIFVPRKEFLNYYNPVIVWIPILVWESASISDQYSGFIYDAGTGQITFSSIFVDGRRVLTTKDFEVVSEIQAALKELKEQTLENHERRIVVLEQATNVVNGDIKNAIITVFDEGGD